MHGWHLPHGQKHITETGQLRLSTAPATLTVWKARNICTASVLWLSSNSVHRDSVVLDESVERPDRT